MSSLNQWRCQVAGWLLFIVSALFFLFGAWRDGDWIGLLASGAFLIACFVFLAPLVAGRSLQS